MDIAAQLHLSLSVLVIWIILIKALRLFFQIKNDQFIKTSDWQESPWLWKHLQIEPASFHSISPSIFPTMKVRERYGITE